MTRYGHISYTEAMTMPLDDMKEYTGALTRMVKEENAAPSS